MCMTHDKRAPRLLAGSLDQSVKVYDLSRFAVTHTMRFSSPVMSIGISGDVEYPTLAVGMLDGHTAIRKRSPTSIEEKGGGLLTKLPPPRAGSKRYFKRGIGYKPRGRDVVIKGKKRKKLRPYDVFIRKFQYNNALDAAMKEAHPVIVVSVIDELMQRNGLKIALSGRTDADLLPVLAFVVKHIANPHYTRPLLQTANLILDLYGSVCRQSSMIDDLVMKLKVAIKNELTMLDHMQKIVANVRLLGANGLDSVPS